MNSNEIIKRYLNEIVIESKLVFVKLFIYLRQTENEDFS